MPNPFLKPPPRAKRDKPRRTIGRVILRGADKEELRREVFRRSGGHCEALTRPMGNGPAMADWYRCYALISWDTFELSHLQHGPRRSDTPETTIASCKECHQRVHNPKSVPRKPGRLMSKKEAMDYWQDGKCFCGDVKRPQSTFCSSCMRRLSPQLAFDVERATGKDYLNTVAEAERELLTA